MDKCEKERLDLALSHPPNLLVVKTLRITHVESNLCVILGSKKLIKYISFAKLLLFHQLSNE